MPAPCSGVRGGPRKIARPAKCGGPGANNRVSGVWLYIGLCYGFILLYAPAFLSLLGKLWRRPRGLLVICSGRLRRPRQGLGSIKPRTNEHKAPCSKHKHMFMAKMFWRSWESSCFVFLSPSSSLVSCELFVSMRVIHQKQLKLSELYATLYHSLCRCLIPPLYTMFMTTTLCHNCPFCWMLQVVTLCCLLLRHPYARNVSHFTLYCFMQKLFWYIFP